MLLFIIAIVGTSGIIPTMIDNGYTNYNIFMYMLNMITIAVPPTLPIALQSGISISNRRYLF